MAIQRKPGVKGVKVDLNTGHLDIALMPGNSLSVEDFRKAVVANGFEPKTAQIEAIGTLESSGSVKLFKITGTTMQPKLLESESKITEAMKSKQVRVLGELDEQDQVLTVRTVDPIKPSPSP